MLSTESHASGTDLRRGIHCAPGSILWNAIEHGSVSKYLEAWGEYEATGNAGRAPTQPKDTPHPTASENGPGSQEAPTPSSPPPQVEVPVTTGRLPRRAATSRSVSRAPSVPSTAAPAADPSPSTGEDIAPAAGPSSTASRKVSARSTGALEITSAFETSSRPRSPTHGLGLR